MSQDKIEKNIELLQQAMQDRFPGFQSMPFRGDKFSLVIKEHEIQVKDLFLLLSYLQYNQTIEELRLSYNLLDADWLMEFKKLCKQGTLVGLPGAFLFNFTQETGLIEKDHSNASSKALLTFIQNTMKEQFEEGCLSEKSLIVFNISRDNILRRYHMFLIFSWLEVNRQVTQLVLWGNLIDDGWFLFYRDIQVAHVNLFANNIRNRGLQSLAANPFIASLDFRKNGNAETKDEAPPLGHDAATYLMQNSTLKELHIDYPCLRRKDASNVSTFMALRAKKSAKVFQKFIAKGDALDVGFRHFPLIEKNTLLQHHYSVEIPKEVLAITQLSRDLVGLLWTYLPNFYALSPQEKAARLEELDRLDNAVMSEARERYLILQKQLEYICKAIHTITKSRLSRKPKTFVDLSVLSAYVDRSSSDPWVTAWHLYAQALELHPDNFSERKAFIVQKTIALKNSNTTKIQLVQAEIDKMPDDTLVLNEADSESKLAFN